MDPQELLVKYHLNSKLNFVDIYTDTFTKIPEIHQFALELSSDYHIGIITDIYPGMLEKLLQKDLIPDLSYSPIIQSWKIKVRKPQKEIYDYALAKSGYKLGEILFVDDNQANITAALNLGWNCVLFDEWHPEKSIEIIRSVLSQFMIE
jgi:FMN phosphatase YigB (HAD superfamily)